MAQSFADVVVATAGKIGSTSAGKATAAFDAGLTSVSNHVAARTKIGMAGSGGYCLRVDAEGRVSAEVPHHHRDVIASSNDARFATVTKNVPGMVKGLLSHHSAKDFAKETCALYSVCLPLDSEAFESLRYLLAPPGMAADVPTTGTGEETPPCPVMHLKRTDTDMVTGFEDSHGRGVWSSSEGSLEDLTRSDEEEIWGEFRDSLRFEMAAFGIEPQPPARPRGAMPPINPFSCGCASAIMAPPRQFASAIKKLVDMVVRVDGNHRERARTYGKDVAQAFLSGAIDLTGWITVEIMLPEDLVSIVRTAAVAYGSSHKCLATYDSSKMSKIVRAHCEKDPECPIHLMQYYQYATLLLSCGLYLDSTANGVHVRRLSGLSKQPIPAPKDGVTATVEVEIDELYAAVTAHRDYLPPGIVPGRAAPEMSGQWPQKNGGKGLKFHLDEEALEAYIAARKDLDGDLPGIGIATGPDLLGAQFPLDPKNPLTAVSGATRHVMDAEFTIACGDGVTYDYCLRKTDAKKKRDLSSLRRVWQKMAEQDVKRMRAMLAKEGQPCDLPSPPKSFSDEMFEDEMFKAFDPPTPTDTVGDFTWTIFNKVGEAAERARWITMPGQGGSEKMHQARMSTIVALIEKMLLAGSNHKSVKGLNEEQRREFFEAWLRTLDKDDAILSFDKKANDRSWTTEHFVFLVEYVERVFAPFEFDYGLPTEMFEGSQEKYCAKLKHAYFRVILDTLLVYLPSGINPTSLGNRLQSEAEEGVLAMAAFGEEAFEQWLEDRISGDELEGWEDWHPPLTKYVLAKRAPIGAVNEGDDKACRINMTRAYNAPGIKLKPEQKTVPNVVRRIAEIMDRYTGFAYEVAPISPDVIFGRKAVMEFCSTYIGCNREPLHVLSTTLCVAIPKPIKTLKKMAWSTTNAVDLIRSPSGAIVNVSINQKLHIYCATKMFSLAEVNRDSPVVGLMMLRVGQYHMTRITDPESAPVYHERSLESRGLSEEELPDTILELEERAKWLVESRIFTYDSTFVAAIAWATDLSLTGKVPLGKIQTALMDVHEVLGQWYPTDGVMDNPLGLLVEMPWGVLKLPLIKLAQRGYKSMLATLVDAALTDPDATVENTRRHLTHQKTTGKTQTPGGKGEKKESDTTTSKPAPHASTARALGLFTTDSSPTSGVDDREDFTEANGRSHPGARADPRVQWKLSNGRWEKDDSKVPNPVPAHNVKNRPTADATGGTASTSSPSNSQTPEKGSAAAKGGKGKGKGKDGKGKTSGKGAKGTGGKAAAKGGKSKGKGKANHPEPDRPPRDAPWRRDPEARSSA